MSCQGSRTGYNSKCRKERVLARRSDSHRNFLGKEKQSRWYQLRIVEGTRDVQGSAGAQWLHPLSVGGRNPVMQACGCCSTQLQFLGLVGE